MLAGAIFLFNALSLTTYDLYYYIPHNMTPLPWTPKMEYMMVKGGLLV